MSAEEIKKKLRKNRNYRKRDYDEAKTNYYQNELDALDGAVMIRKTRPGPAIFYEAFVNILIF
jgi:hypothetical protein